jgi:hypothetical protein
MRDVSSARFDDGDQDSFEDLDALFDHLECFEPPVDMVKRIMDAVSMLPPQSRASDNQDGLIVRYQNKQPS